MSSETQAQIHQFIAGRYPDVEMGVDEDIFALGFSNSLFAVELVMFIEKTFGFTVRNDELRLDNFRTVRSMAELVQRQTVPATQG